MPWRREYASQVCSLGYFLIDWIETFCCHGPGDVQGQPVELDDEFATFIVEAYRLDPRTGRRMVDEAVLSRPKGRAKSELAGLVGVAEARAPARFDHWARRGGEVMQIAGHEFRFPAGQPVGRPVLSPLLKCLATEESQAGNTFENIAFICGDWGKEQHPEIYGKVRGARQYQSATSLYLPGGGEIRACTSGSVSKDGGKETWACADETHLYVTNELRAMYGTVQRNTVKRAGIAEPWLMQTTTAYRLGQDSIAEATLRAWRKDEFDTHTYVDHRQAEGKIRIEDTEHTLAQLDDVYGPAASWMDLGRILRAMRDPRICEDESVAARYYLNRVVRGRDQWCDPTQLRSTGEVPKAGEAVALGFDGSQSDDSTALWGCRLSDAHYFRVHLQESDGVPGWRVDADDVEGAVDRAFELWDVALMFADPWGDWRPYVDRWAGKHGAKVREFDTRHQVKMAVALDRMRADILAGASTYDGNKALPTHIANAVVRRRGDLVLISKDRPDSLLKIDVAMAAALARAAREQALTELEEPVERHNEMYAGDGRRGGSSAAAASRARSDPDQSPRRPGRGVAFL